VPDGRWFLLSFSPKRHFFAGQPFSRGVERRMVSIGKCRCLVFLNQGEHDQRNEQAREGPLTIRTMREHGFLL